MLRNAIEIGGIIQRLQKIERGIQMLLKDRNREKYQEVAENRERYPEVVRNS